MEDSGQGGNWQVPPGPFKHLQRGLIIRAEEAVTFEMEVMGAEDVDMRRVTRQLIDFVWPSTTALTFSSPTGVGAGESDFHTERIRIAKGEYNCK